MPHIHTQPAHCPACGRYTGPALECPFCEIALPKHRFLHPLRRATMGIAFTGIALLWLWAAHTSLQVTPIGELTPGRIGRTRVVGSLSSKPSIDYHKGVPTHVRFKLADRSGQITVSATRQVARDLVEQGRIPAKGAILQATGHMSPDRDRRPRLFLESATALSPVPVSGESTL